MGKLPFKLDYTIATPEERAKYIKEKTELYPIPQTDTSALEMCSNYILDGLSHTEKKTHNITSDNRRKTIDKHETSFEGLISKFESGEDGVYQLMSHLGKAEYITPRQRIDPREAVKTPEIRQLRQAIAQVENLERTAIGRDRIMLKQQLIEMHQEQYIIRNELKPPMEAKSYYRTETLPSPTVGEETVSWDGTVTTTAQVSLIEPTHIAQIIKHYDELRRAVESAPNSEVKDLLDEFESLVENELKNKHKPWYYMVKMRAMKLTNNEISVKLYSLYGDPVVFPEAIAEALKHSIPKQLAIYEKKRICMRHYTAHKELPWKTCSKCNQTFPANLLFFARNPTRDKPNGLYCMCKDCRAVATSKMHGKTRFELSRTGTFTMTEQQVRDYLLEHTRRYYPANSSKSKIEPLVRLKENADGKYVIVEDLRKEKNGNDIENNLPEVQENVFS